MKLLRIVQFALIGWLAGTVGIVALTLLWPGLFPGILPPELPAAEATLTLPLISLITALLTSLPALLGGIIGGTLIREGGKREQRWAAALGGLLLTLPLGICNLWLMSGS